MGTLASKCHINGPCTQIAQDRDVQVYIAEHELSETQMYISLIIIVMCEWKILES